MKKILLCIYLIEFKICVFLRGQKGIEEKQCLFFLQIIGFCSSSCIPELDSFYSDPSSAKASQLTVNNANGDFVPFYCKRGFSLTRICWKIPHSFKEGNFLIGNLLSVGWMKICPCEDVHRSPSLQVYDGPTVHSRPIATYCGADPASFASSGSSMTIQFQSDSTVSGQGFLLEWNAVDASAVTRTIVPGGFSVGCTIKSDIASDILSFT